MSTGRIRGGRVSGGQMMMAEFLKGLGQTFNNSRDRQERQRLLSQQDNDAKFQRWMQGRREGQAPTEAPVVIEDVQASFDTSFTPPPMAQAPDWTASLTFPGMPKRDGSGFSDEPSVGINQLRGVQPPRSAPGAVERAPVPTPEDQAFAGRPVDAQPAAQAGKRSWSLGTTGRYQQINANEYIDTFATPQGMQERASLAVQAAQQAAADLERARLASLYRGVGVTPAEAELRAAGGKPPEPTAPRNIDPLSAEGIQAQIRIAQARAQATAQNRAPSRAAAGRPLPSSAVEKIVGLDNMLDVATDVQQSLKEAVKNKTNATGRLLGFKTPRFAKDMVGMGGTAGVDIRTKIGNLFATVAKERGGTALSAAELGLLESYMPNEHDDETIALRKANQFIVTLRRMRENKLKAYQGYGYGGGGVVDDEAPMQDQLTNGLPHPDY